MGCWLVVGPVLNGHGKRCGIAPAQAGAVVRADFGKGRDPLDNIGPQCGVVPGSGLYHDRRTVAFPGAIQTQPSALHIHQAAGRRITFEVGSLAHNLIGSAKCCGQAGQSDSPSDNPSPPNPVSHFVSLSRGTPFTSLASILGWLHLGECQQWHEPTVCCWSYDSFTSKGDIYPTVKNDPQETFLGRHSGCHVT